MFNVTLHKNAGQASHWPKMTFTIQNRSELQIVTLGAWQNSPKPQKGAKIGKNLKNWQPLGVETTE